MNEVYKRGDKRKFNGWQVDAMREMKKKGTNCEQIGRKFNCAGNTVRYLIDGEFKEKQKIWSKSQYQKMKEMGRKPAKPAVQRFGEKAREAFHKASLAEEIDGVGKEDQGLRYAYQALDNAIGGFNKGFYGHVGNKINKTNEITDEKITDEMKEAWLEKTVINRTIDRVVEISNKLGIPKIIETMITTPTKPNKDRLDKLIYAVGKRALYKYLEEEKAKR